MGTEDRKHRKGNRESECTQPPVPIKRTGAEAELCSLTHHTAGTAPTHSITTGKYIYNIT
uniref:Uncharacterized protein n=1 Tax=Anguilla anguilla TaxID=7936 RepID=A0A0E9W3W1_ANGAN